MTPLLLVSWFIQTIQMWSNTTSRKSLIDLQMISPKHRLSISSWNRWHSCECGWVTRIFEKAPILHQEVSTQRPFSKKQVQIAYTRYQSTFQAYDWSIPVVIFYRCINSLIIWETKCFMCLKSSLQVSTLQNFNMKKKLFNKALAKAIQPTVKLVSWFTNSFIFHTLQKNIFTKILTQIFHVNTPISHKWRQRTELGNNFFRPHCC